MTRPVARVPESLLIERLNAGESLAQRAERMGIARGTLKTIEDNPLEMPTAATAKKVADFYAVRVTDLWPVESTEAAA